MSAGDPGICGAVDRCLRGDGALGLNSQIIRLHVLKKFHPDDFWRSYRFMYRDGRLTPGQPVVTKVMISGEECEAIEDVALPIYDRCGNLKGERKFTVIFTDQVLMGTRYICATISDDSKIVGEELLAA